MTTTTVEPPQKRGSWSGRPIDVNAVPPQWLGAFVSHIEFGPGCWNWTGASTANEYGGQPYGYFREWRASRFAYALWVGPLLPGLTIDHLCHNRLCVRPDHLEQVTHKVNTLRGDTIQARNAAKTHCPKGHPYDAQNTRITPKGQRECRKCLYARQRRYLARRALREAS